MCNILNISKSSYYSYLKGESHQKPIESGLGAELRQVFQSHKRRYGSRRLHAELKDMGYKIGRHGVRKLLEEQGLKAIQPLSFVPKTTNSKHGLVACPNLLGMGFEAVKPHQAWVSDITYIPLKGAKWAYLAAWTDIYTRRIVGWAIDTSMTQELIIAALSSAVRRYKPTNGLILHSDRGGQYFGLKFKQLIDKYQFRQSMAGVKSAYENAHAESIWATIKRELIEKGSFESFEDAKTELFDYIEVYYNRQRRHSALGYLSPENFEQIYNQKQLTNLQSKVSAI
jgi:transposase InsO family protein